MTEEEHGLVFGIRTAVQVLATTVQEMMSSKDAQLFRDRIEGHCAFFKEEEIYGTPGAREVMAATFRGIFMPGDDDTTPKFTVIDGGKTNDD
ncbi:MAG: hypothetical protein J0I08_06715 [Rhizobiales bacterium]|nr:hypothetical protein [Hyphomicrobiales bacterium]